jgi:ATP-dependent Clp protease ATP-binding subunit ClpC
MFERFTERARRSMVLAQEEARLLGHNFIGTEHLLLGLVHEGEGVGAVALDRLGVSLEAVRAKVEQTMGAPGLLDGGTGSGGSPPFTPRSKKVLELALREALQLGHNYIGTEHVLLGIVREGEGVAARVLVELGASLQATRATVLEVLGELPRAGPQQGGYPGVPVGSPSSGSPPDCPHCRSSLAATAAVHRLELDGHTFIVVYCTECGRSLAFRPTDT